MDDKEPKISRAVKYYRKNRERLLAEAKERHALKMALAEQGVEKYAKSVQNKRDYNREYQRRRNANCRAYDAMVNTAVAVE